MFRVIAGFVRVLLDYFSRFVSFLAAGLFIWPYLVGPRLPTGRLQEFAAHSAKVFTRLDSLRQAIQG